MNQKLEIRRISTPERTFSKISEGMAQPVAIVLFGADCDAKDATYMNCVERIPNLATGYGGKGSMSLRAAKHPLSEGRSVLTVMPGGSSLDHSQRHEVVQALRDLGAKTVVGMYAKCNLPESSFDGATPTVIDSPFKKQVRSLLQSPPTADEFDYLIIV